MIIIQAIYGQVNKNTSAKNIYMKYLSGLMRLFLSFVQCKQFPHLFFQYEH